VIIQCYHIFSISRMDTTKLTVSIIPSLQVLVNSPVHSSTNCSFCQLIIFKTDENDG